MTTSARIAAWIDRYVAAWESNDPDDITALFTADARYFTAPFREPWVGHTQIVAGWLERDDRPGTWAFTYEVENVVGDTGYVRGRTIYTTDPVEPYSNLWKVTLDGGSRCTEFVEWWMDERDSGD